MFRFNANISYSGVLHAVTQDVSVFKSCANYVRPFARERFTLISLPLSLSVFLLRVFSLRTKRSSSTTPSWLFCPRRPSCRLLMLSWRAISRPFDAWWPPRLASRLSPSCLSKNAAFIPFHFPAFISLKSVFGELLVTGMLCHSKVWSRVWSCRCDVNMNPYISVCPLPVSYPSFLAVLQWAFLSFIFVLLSSQTFQKGGYVTQPLSASICLDLPLSPSHAIVLCLISLPLSACPVSLLYFCISQYLKTSFWVTEMYERSCIYCFLFVPVKQMSHNWFSWKIHC